MPMVAINCEHCTKSFRTMVAPSQKIGRFCSRPCLWASNLIASDTAYIEANSIPEPNSGCWLWLQSLNVDGYGIVQLKNRSDAGAHRVSWKAFHGSIPEGMVVRHICDNPCCVNPDHLRLGTHADNSADKVSRNRHTKGVQINTAVLCEKDVLHIRMLWGQGETVTDISKSYPVTTEQIKKIVTRQAWKHV